VKFSCSYSRVLLFMLVFMLVVLISISGVDASPGTGVSGSSSSSSHSSHSSSSTRSSLKVAYASALKASKKASRLSRIQFAASQVVEISTKSAAHTMDDDNGEIHSAAFFTSEGAGTSSDLFRKWAMPMQRAHVNVNTAVLSEEEEQQQTTPPHMPAPPAHFDARIRWPECIGTSVPQGACAASWALAASESLADRACIANDDGLANARRRVLSAESLLTCHRRSLGCALGGDVAWAWQLLEASGAPGAACLPYTSGKVPTHDVQRSLTSTVLARRGRRHRTSTASDACTRFLSEGAAGTAPDTSGCAPQIAAPGSYAAFRRALHDALRTPEKDAHARVIASSVANDGPVDATLALYDDLHVAFRACEANATTPCGVYAGPGEDATYLGVVAVSIVGYGNAPWHVSPPKHHKQGAAAASHNETKNATNTQDEGNATQDGGRLGLHTSYLELAKKRITELAVERDARAEAEYPLPPPSAYASSTMRTSHFGSNRHTKEMAEAAMKYSREHPPALSATSRIRARQMDAELPMNVDRLLAGHARADDLASAGAVLGGAPFWLVRHYWGARVGLPGGHLVVPMFDTKLRLEASAGAGLPTFAAPQSSQQASMAAPGLPTFAPQSSSQQVAMAAPGEGDSDSCPSSAAAQMDST